MKLPTSFLNYLMPIAIIIATPLTISQSFASSLENHPSPYLRMHQSDPVKWQTWGKDVLEQAKKENKLIFMSIGYFSCHWCHVMQKESYSHPDIGAILNDNFIPVKVDRELRPELDRRMIQFVESVRGYAGWPLNVFLTADGYPVTGFTYLNKIEFEKVLISLNKEWRENHQQLADTAKKYFEQIESNETKSDLVNLPDQHFPKVVDAFISQAMLIGDDLQGGFGKTNKFPSYPQLNSLLKAIIANPAIDSDIVDFFHLTLRAMASYHLMDHVNFGFYRYVVDPDWQTPHFEKMLYDNAQLASLYFDAHQQWPTKGYADIALKTLDFMNQFMANGEGGFNASLSAVDTENNEGGGYYWDAVELKKLLNDKEYEAIKKAWEFDDDESLILIRPLTGIGLSLSDKAQMTSILKKLQSVKKATMPVDTKALASWNALALKAWVRASQHHPTVAIKKQTKEFYLYIVNNFIKDGKVIKFAGQGDAAETTLEDYAQLAHAIQLYANYSKDPQAEKIAQTLVGIAFNQYYTDGRWRRNTDSLIPGDKGDLVIQDAVLESPVSLLLETVFLMNNPDPKIKELSHKLMKRLTRDVLDVPYYYSSAIMLRKLHTKESSMP